MRPSVLPWLALLIVLSGCAARQRPLMTMHPKVSSRKKHAPAKPIYGAQTATMKVIFGIPIIGIATLPTDFNADFTRAPLWFNVQGQAVLGLIGSLGGRHAVLGFSGAGLAERRVLLADYGPGALAGRLLDVALSPDGTTLATAVASVNNLEIDLSGTSDSRERSTIAKLNGTFGAVQLAWLSNSKIALLAERQPETGEGSSESSDDAPVRELYIVSGGEHRGIKRLDNLRCALSPLSFSPNGYFAVAQGEPDSPPALFDLRSTSCAPLKSAGPIRVLGWSPNSDAFLYAAPFALCGGVFRFDLRTRQSGVIAVSSAAAAYARDGTIVAFGNQQLSWQRAAAEPTGQVKAEIALFDPRRSQVTINSLGFTTQPRLLAQSTMLLSQASGDAIIDTAIPGGALPIREIIEYSYPQHAAFAIANGAVSGPVSMSWSPDGELLAMLDGNGAYRTLTVLAPPQ